MARADHMTGLTIALAATGAGVRGLTSGVIGGGTTTTTTMPIRAGTG